MLLTMQIVGLFVGIWFTFVNIGKILRGHQISCINVVIMSSGWTAFVAARWLI
jgi:uncharacterized membrane protein